MRFPLQQDVDQKGKFSAETNTGTIPKPVTGKKRWRQREKAGQSNYGSSHFSIENEESISALLWLITNKKHSLERLLQLKAKYGLN